MEAHCHATDPFTLKVALRDGLTTCMDFEAGIRNVDQWHKMHEGKSQVNFGHVCCAAFARLAALDGPDIAEHGHDSGDLMSKCLPLAAKRAKAEGRPMGWNACIPDKLQMTQIMMVLDDELRQGALGVGIPIGYMTNGVSSYEMFKHQQLASLCGRVSNAHTRFIGKMPPLEGALGIQELMCNAMVLNAPVMIAHVNSVNDWEFTVPCVNLARKNGHKVFAEACPYHAGSSTACTDVLLPENMKSLGIVHNDVCYVEPYERWTKEIYDKRMDNGDKMMILELNKPEDIKKWMADPETIVCSDAMSCLNPKDCSYCDWDEPFEGKSVHPRTSGTRGTFLRMVREEKEMNVDLMTAISRMSFLPAKCYDELCGIPHFRWKGCMQVGCDADITIFDPETVTDNSSCDIGKGMIPATGVPHALVKWCHCG